MVGVGDPCPQLLSGGGGGDIMLGPEDPRSDWPLTSTRVSCTVAGSQLAVAASLLQLHTDWSE